MPNHCYCTLTIDGPEADLAHLRNRIKTNDEGDHILLASVLPMPAALEGTTWPSPLDTGEIADAVLGKKRPLTEPEREHLASLKAMYGHSDWYSWQDENWGMKWGDCNTEIDWDDPLVLEFWRPWVPPVA